MSANVLVILSSGEKEKALTGIMYAVNSQKNQWLENVKVVFFGPFERLICEDESVAKAASRLLEYETPIACKFISDDTDLSGKLEELGYDVEYVGTIISEYIQMGYVPMVF